LGHKPSVALVGWPKVNESLLIADTVIAVIQINGKIKERIEVSPLITDSQLEISALAHPAIVEALSGETVTKVITRAPKIVNIVINNG
jgi:leucyl-tRNA synthetase